MIFPRNPCPDLLHKIDWLKVTLAGALACSLVLSWRLWISSRLFPLSPVGNFLPRIPFPLDVIWFSLLLGLLIAIIIVARPRTLILAFLGLAVLLCLWDQTRWQPWVYQYLCMLAGIGLLAWKQPDRKHQETALNVCRMIIVFTYLWSGLQKLNANFVHETWPDISAPFFHFLPQVAGKFPPLLALLVPLIEIVVALGLITRRYRNVSVLLAITTHTFILVLLICSGENMVVWPWNIAMALLVTILFWQDKETRPLAMFVSGNWLHVLVLLLFGVLPALNLADLWDSYLSAALYSGNTHQAVILVPPEVIDHLPAAVQPHIWRSSRPYFLDVNRWAYAELNVPVYPEPRIYRRISQEVCKYVDNSPGVKLMIRGKPNPFTGYRTSEYYDCDHLSSI